MAANSSVGLWACCVCVLLLAAATDARGVGHAKATATHGIDDSQTQESVAALLGKAALLEEEQPVLEEEKSIILDCYNNQLHQDEHCWLTCVDRRFRQNNLEPLSDYAKCRLHKGITSIEEIMTLFDLFTRAEPGSTLKTLSCEAKDEIKCEPGKTTDLSCTCFSDCVAQQDFLCEWEELAQRKGLDLKHDLMEYFAVNYCGEYVEGGHGFRGEKYQELTPEEQKYFFCPCLAADACEKIATYTGKFPGYYKGFPPIAWY